MKTRLTYNKEGEYLDRLSPWYLLHLYTDFSSSLIGEIYFHSTFQTEK